MDERSERYQKAKTKLLTLIDKLVEADADARLLHEKGAAKKDLDAASAACEKLRDDVSKVRATMRAILDEGKEKN